MAVTLITKKNEYIGLSSDTKPTSVLVGSTFYAYDTGIKYITYDGTNYDIENLITNILEPLYVSPDNQFTTNDYADVTGSKIDTYGKTKVSITCVNLAVGNSINWKVLASNDDISYIEAQAEATLAPDVVGSYSNTLATYRYYKVQIKATVGGSHGTAQVREYSKI